MGSYSGPEHSPPAWVTMTGEDAPPSPEAFVWERWAAWRSGRLPAGHPATIKVRTALAALPEAKAGLDHEVRLWSQLPVGKGMASSTADIAAALGAWNLAAGRVPSPEELARRALAVEPSDGVMLPGIALFDHRRGLRFELLGDPPPIDILVFDFGGEVDTIAFNGADLHPLNVRKEPAIRDALELLRAGLREQDPRLIGEAASTSALVHQEILPKAGLERALELARAAGGMGICVAHSGTVVGLLFDPNRVSAREAESFLVPRMIQPSGPGAAYLGISRLTGGGLRALESPAPGAFPGNPVKVT